MNLVRAWRTGEVVSKESISHQVGFCSDKLNLKLKAFMKLNNVNGLTYLLYLNVTSIAKVQIRMLSSSAITSSFFV